MKQATMRHRFHALCPYFAMFPESFVETWIDRLTKPGDLVLGDDDGVVIVDKTECDAVLEKSLKRIKAEDVKANQLRTGISSVELNKLDTVFKSLGLVEEE